MPLFYNHNFKIGLSSIYNNFMYDNGIRFVRDIVNTSGQFLQQSILENYIGTKINYLILARTVANFQVGKKNWILIANCDSLLSIK